MSARILVIEDNAVNMELMVYMLKAFGHDPLPARDGAQGLTLARTQAPAMILCDIQLPGLDGYELARLIKQDETLRRIPLIAVTAYAMVGDQERILAAGFDGYVAKPIEPAELGTLIARMLAQAPPVCAPGPIGANPDRPRRGPTILVLDDHGLNLEFQLDLLEPLGYRVLTAESIPRAMALARENTPDLIISDVGLTDTHGFDFIRQIKGDAKLRDVPFIFMTTTHWEDGIREAGLALGADRFLFRPMDAQALLAEIQACLPAPPPAQAC